MAAWLIVLGVIVLAIAYVFYNYFRIRRMGEGTAEMIEMAEIIRSGAATFLKTEYRTISIVVLLVALVFSLFIEKTSGITFLIGACMSSAVCVLGMRSATYANVRTANRARETLSIGETVKVALCGGQHFRPERAGLRHAGSGAGAGHLEGHRPFCHRPGPAGQPALQSLHHAGNDLFAGLLAGGHVQPCGGRQLHQGR